MTHISQGARELVIPKLRRIKKYSCIIGGHRTSLSLEKPYWDILQRQRETRGLKMSALLLEIQNELLAPSSFLFEHASGFNSAVRLWCLKMTRNTK